MVDDINLKNVLFSEFGIICLLLPLLKKLQAVVKGSNVYPKDAEAPSCGVDDMTKLAYLHEPGVLQNLRSRYDMNEIYVSVYFKSYNHKVYFLTFAMHHVFLFFSYSVPLT